MINQLPCTHSIDLTLVRTEPKKSLIYNATSTSTPSSPGNKRKCIEISTPINAKSNKSVLWPKKLSTFSFASEVKLSHSSMFWTSRFLQSLSSLFPLTSVAGWTYISSLFFSKALACARPARDIVRAHRRAIQSGPCFGKPWDSSSEQ